MNKDYLLIGGALTCGGNLLAWYKSDEMFGSEVFERNINILNDRLANSTLQYKVDTSIPVLLPFLNGERSPGFRSSAHGVLCDIQLSTTSIEILQSIIEGVSFRLTDICKEMMSFLQVGHKDSLGRINILASGKSLDRCNYWCQVLCNCTGLSVIQKLGGGCEDSLLGVAVNVIQSSSDNVQFHPCVFSDCNLNAYNVYFDMNDEPLHSRYLKHKEIYECCSTYNL